MLLGAVITGLACAALFVIAGYSFYLDGRFASNDVVRTSAIVDRLSAGHRSNRGNTYLIYFHYSLLHDSFYTKSSANEKTGDSLHVGSSLPIKYLQDSPQTCRIDLPVEDAENGRNAPTAIQTGLIFGCFCAYCIWQYKRTPKQD